MYHMVIHVPVFVQTTYCRAFAEKGAKRVIGIEPNPMSTSLFSDHPGLKQMPVDIFAEDTSSSPHLCQSFDLVMSIEVAEHIDRQLHERLFNFLSSKAKHWIVFSGARIGQGGIGHIAERSEEDWRQEFIQRGWLYRDDLTRDLRHRCNVRNVNHRRNVMVFEWPHSQEQ